MKKWILAVLLTSALNFAYAKPYPQHDLSKIITPNRVDFALAEQVYQDLSRHAARYPTQFDNANDKVLAVKEAKELARIFNALFETKIITPKHEAYLQLLHRAARVNWIAHNLDVPQAATWTERHYQTLMMQLSGKEKAILLSEYGSFLASSGQTQKAVIMYQNAIKQGYPAAKRELSMVLLSQNKREQAVQTMHEYVQAHPKDTAAKELLVAMKTGRVQIKSTQ